MEQEIQLPPVHKAEESSAQRVMVCRGRSCRQYSAERVLENFKRNLPADVELISVPCLGQCGNGTMVLVESDRTWYSQVHPDEVATVIKQHLINGCPVKAMLYPKFHPKK